MAADDILRLFADAEIVLCVFAGSFRVAEAVQGMLMVFVHMPIV